MLSMTVIPKKASYNFVFHIFHLNFFRIFKFILLEGEQNLDVGSLLNLKF